MELRTIAALVLAFISVGGVIAALFYTNHEGLDGWRRRADKRRKRKRLEETSKD